MTASEPKLQLWELAAKEGKTLIIRVMGPMVSVYYPYAKSGHLYVVGADGPNQIFHCCQKCDADYPIAEFIGHVNKHNRQFRKFPDIIIDSQLVAPAIRGQLTRYESKSHANQIP